MTNVSIIIPVIRPEKAARCISMIRENAGDGVNYEIVSSVDEDRMGAPKMVKELVAQTKYDLVCFLGDDTLPQKDFLKNAVLEMNQFEGRWGLVGLNDESGRKLACHWLAHKKLLPLIGGEFFHTGYRHCFCDNELQSRCKMLGRYHYSQVATVLHDHPMVIKHGTDSNMNFIADHFEEDQELFNQRKRLWDGTLRVGLCLPIVNRLLDRSFLLSFMNMDKPYDCRIYVPQMEIYGFVNDIADARNSLVYQALEEDCDKIIMMDTDQVYPEDTITKLVGHSLPVVGAMVHRRYPPFAPLLYRGKLGEYKYVLEEEMFSGKLVEVDATGCGCICYDKTVFWELDPPWYENRRGENGKPVGEDVRLCSKIREKGIPISVDTSILIDHMATFNVNRDFYLLYKKLNLVEINSQPQAKEK